jgi:hypothetical protein
MTQQAETSFEKVQRKLVAARIELLSRLSEFNADELNQPGPEDGWTALQIAWHVSIAEKLAMEEVQRVVNEDNPMIENLSVKAPHVTNQTPPPPLPEVLDALNASREALFTYLSALPESDWTRSLQSPQWGNLKLYQIVNVLQIHEHTHAQQLETIKASLQ